MTHRSYDYRLKKLIANNGDPNLFPDLCIPRSTALGWIKHGVPDVVTLPELDRDVGELVAEIAVLKAEVNTMRAKETLVITTFRIFGLQIQFRRLPSTGAKQTLIDAVNAAAKIVPLTVCLEAIGLSAARFRAWCRRKALCLLQAQSSCPRSSPQKLLSADIAKIKEFVTSARYAHFSIQALATYAKRARDVFASPSTWHRIISTLDLVRPRKRIYPARPKIGIRADAPFASGIST